ncbi:MAG: hypothetical protein GKR94_30735 [Gammaproteobacteria bacterium]|nr:hypothetical protein [Gammaproteobacteria bacterium]
MSTTALEAAEELEARQIGQLEEQFIQRSQLYHLADGVLQPTNRPPGVRVLMKEDPRLPAMPKAPTLIDFFKLRFSAGQQHLLQSARLARNNGLPDKMVLACLLHDIAVIGFIRAEHGYWGAQLLEPYVDEEVSWAIRMHQVMKFFPDEAIGYEYPQAYVQMFGADFEPEPYAVAEYERARDHKWYLSARIICLNDEYSFDPGMHLEIEEFEDVIGRHFKQPKEGLGNDNSPSAHMWRTLRRPCSAL